MTAPSAEARRLAAISRANRTTRPTTRPGSETTDLSIGDKVRANRESARSGGWSAYDGREGWVATLNHQRFSEGRTYVEIGVCWFQPKNWKKVSADVWFRADELVRA